MKYTHMYASIYIQKIRKYIYHLCPTNKKVAKIFVVETCHFFETLQEYNRFLFQIVFTFNFSSMYYKTKPTKMKYDNFLSRGYFLMC